MMEFKQLTHNDLPEAVSQICKDIAAIKRLLSTKETPSQEEKNQSYTLTGILDYIKEKYGLEVSKGTVYNKSSEGKIRAHKFNNRLIFYKSEIDEWIKSELENKTGSDNISIRLHKRGPK
jgi:excisionase family DNA binding protein